MMLGAELVSENSVVKLAVSLISLPALFLKLTTLFFRFRVAWARDLFVLMV